MSSVTAPIVKNSHIQAEIYFFLLKNDLKETSKKRPKRNLKVCQYQILTSVKRSEKQLASKANFTTFCNLVT